MKEKDIEGKGQVFTPEFIVDKMLGLRKNFGSVLEPSCGDGAFFNKIPNCVGVEIDSNFCPEGGLCENFFNFKRDSVKFDTIIGNPPYIKYKNIDDETKSLLDESIFDKRTNLYAFFIYECFKLLKDNGELIFITPREFLKSTSCRKLNKILYENGTFTYMEEMGDAVIFSNATPNCVIFRYLKNDLSHVTDDGRDMTFHNGQIIFSECNSQLILGDIAEVKVGGVSGMDSIFRNSHFGNEDFVYSMTVSTGETVKMIHNEINEYLLEHKEELINRKIKKFTEKNWWKWGREFPVNDRPRIYVNCKTRVKEPFFLHECKNFDGSVLAIFPKEENIDIEGLKNDLNKVDWETLGFKCGGRFIFSQRTLENAPLNREFEKYKDSLA